MKYTSEQLAAYDSLVDFLMGFANIFILTGFSGTGKTTLLRKLVQDFLLATSRSDSCLFTAPTNKATKLLMDVLNLSPVQCKTIYSALHIRMDIDYKTGDLKLIYPEEPIDLSPRQVIFIDEASMISSELLTYIMKNYPNTKLVFIGDPAQLPPVNETISPVFKSEFSNQALGAHLNQVMRHDNQILNLATRLRESIDTTIIPQITEDHDFDTGVFKMNTTDFRSVITTYSDQMAFKKTNFIKVLAWRNATVESYNSLVRERMFKNRAQEQYLVGDHIMMAAPKIKRERQRMYDSKGKPYTVETERVILTVDDEGKIVDRKINKHSKYNLDVYCLVVDFYGEKYQLNILHPNSMQAYNAILKSLADRARKPKCGYIWKEFWALKRSFDQIRYSYCITTHRAQGSSYKNVIVDVQDILANKNKNEALRCLYVAVSRASERVFVN